MICKDPDPFFEELGERLRVIGQEVRPSEAVADRIDILAIDDAGTAVVIELKRGTHKLQLLQAVSSAGMVSRWPEDSFIETLAANYNQSNDDARAAIEDHTGSDISSINHTQRILLIAEDFDPALLVAAEWLTGFDVDIRCYRLQLCKENESDYLTYTCIYPPIELATLPRGSDGKLRQRVTAWRSWEAALASVDNAALIDFVLGALAKHQEARLPRRQVIYRMDGKRRFWLGCRKTYAFVWQEGRFHDDINYWKKVLSEPKHIHEVNGKRGLSFRVTTAEDFSAFGKAMESAMEFFDDADLDQPSEEE